MDSGGIKWRADSYYSAGCRYWTAWNIIWNIIRICLLCAIIFIKIRKIRLIWIKYTVCSMEAPDIFVRFIRNILVSVYFRTVFRLVWLKQNTCWLLHLWTVRIFQNSAVILIISISCVSFHLKPAWRQADTKCSEFLLDN